jgi:hypothetical protein
MRGEPPEWERFFLTRQRIGVTRKIGVLPLESVALSKGKW